MAEISPDNGLVTFVNVFSCAPADQPVLVETLASETESIFRDLPGFVSAAIHASNDGTRVCNYAQWRSLDAYHATMTSERGRALVANVRRTATDVDIHPYRVVCTFGIADRAGAQATELVDRAWDAIEVGDIDRFDDLFDPDVELVITTSQGRGLDNVKRVFQRHHDSYPDLRREKLSCIESGAGDAVAVEWQFTGTQQGELQTPMGPVPPSGQALVWRSSDHVRARDGRIVSWHAQFDRLALAEQLGLLPSQGLPESR